MNFSNDISYNFSKAFGDGFLTFLLIFAAHIGHMIRLKGVLVPRTVTKSTQITGTHTIEEEENLKL